MKIDLSFEVDKELYYKFVKYSVKRASQQQNQFKAFFVNMFVWMFITVIFMLIFKSAASTLSNINWGSALIGSFPFWLIIGYSIHANYNLKKNTVPKHNGIIFGPKTLELVPEGITETGSVSKCHYSWDCVEELVEDFGDYYVYLDKMYALIIPGKAFDSPEILDEFKGCISKYVQQTN